MRIAAVFLWLLGMVAMSTPLACGSHCDAFCPGPTPSLILEASGYVVTSFSSTCANVQLFATASSGDVSGALVDQPLTCHVEATLNDGEHFSLDVPFTAHVDDCCCSRGCIEGFAAIWQPIVVTAPYTPDASPFPPIDASEDTPDASDALAGDADE